MNTKELTSVNASIETARTLLSEASSNLFLLKTAISGNFDSLEPETIDNALFYVLRGLEGIEDHLVHIERFVEKRGGEQ